MLMIHINHYQPPPAVMIVGDQGRAVGGDGRSMGWIYFAYFLCSYPLKTLKTLVVDHIFLAWHHGHWFIMNDATQRECFHICIYIFLPINHLPLCC
jgi:hypothetical protein